MTWILVLLLAGVPLGARGPFPDRQSCMTFAVEQSYALVGSKWESEVNLKCQPREPEEVETHEGEKA